jgi:methionyl-tRNA formyltransferase
MSNSMRIVFMGSSSASATTLRGILKSPWLKVVGVVTQPDRPSGRHQRLTPCPCKAYAIERKIPVIITPEKVNAPAAIDAIRALKPDVIVVVAFGQILRKELLTLAPHGCINGHFSLLPKYRGAAPVQAAVLAGEKVTGVTVMQMDEHMDTGDILLQAVEPICSDDSAGDLMDRLAILCAVTMAKALKYLIMGALVRKPQDHSKATYAGKIQKTDGLIDWARPAVYIRNQIHAYDPWPGAYTFMPANRCKADASGRIKILQVQRIPASADAPNSGPGSVCLISPLGPVVKTGDDLLCITAIQPDGGRPMDGKAFLNGHPLIIGDRFEAAPPNL